jgi:SAM-dependent methyltransferase
VTEAAGGRQRPPLWEQIGRLQFDYLVSAGLRPDQYLLDVGCGGLRGGQHFISYLEPGRYFGIDSDPNMLKRGPEQVLDPATIERKKPVLTLMEDFGVERLGQRFDYALAQSVFTHLPLNSIMRCLVGVGRVLTPGGRFYATFFENTQGKQHVEPIVQEPGGITSFCDADPFHYDFETIARVCEGTGLEAEYIGDWSHPRNQKMLLFTRAADG